MKEEKKGFGYCFDKSLKDLKDNLFLVVPNLAIYAALTIVSLLTLTPLVLKALDNPYLFERYIEENLGIYLGGSFLIILLILFGSLFVMSGNMYMTKRVVNRESIGLRDFITGMTKYPLQLLGFFIMWLIIAIGLSIVGVLTLIIPVLGFLLFLGVYIYFGTIIQSYDAIMSMEDFGVFDTLSKIFDFGKKNFLTLFLLILFQIVIGGMFQATASAPMGAMMDPYTTTDFSISMVVVGLLLMLVQIIVSVFLGTFTRLFRFHLYNANELGGSEIEENAIEDYVVSSKDE